ncbi:MAG: HNH endonuclease [Bacteroidales bacterium]|nr:HNH endonuclease [Bacteroidales bacterium]
MSADPRQRNGHRRRMLRDRVRAEGMPCHICGRAIDYSLPAGHPMSYELDELLPVSKGGDPLSYDNCKASHRICNERKGARMIARKQVEQPKTSRGW